MQASILRTMKITFDLLHFAYFLLVVLGIAVLIYVIILIQEARRVLREVNRALAEISETNNKAKDMLNKVDNILNSVESGAGFAPLIGMLMPFLGNIIGPLINGIFGGKKKQGGSENG